MGSPERATLPVGGGSKGQRRRAGVDGAWVQTNRGPRFRARGASPFGTASHGGRIGAGQLEKRSVMRLAAARSSSIVVPQATRWHQHFVARIVYALIRMVSVTLRYKWTDRSGFFTNPV